MVAYNAGGTDPENTSVSVPRLTPEYNVRTRTSSGPGGARVTGRISPWPGERTQKARASSDMKILPDRRADPTSGPDHRTRSPDPITGPDHRTR
jgi:hypothetical protein